MYTNYKSREKKKRLNTILNNKIKSTLRGVLENVMNVSSLFFFGILRWTDRKACWTIFTVAIPQLGFQSS